MNLVPDKPGKASSYWCTWGSQCATPNPRDNLNENLIFGDAGWLNAFEKVKADLYVVFDDGWDVPYGVDPQANAASIASFGSCEVSEERFPSCAGAPDERLKKLNEKVTSAGWRGAGLWIAAQAKGEDGKDHMLDEAALDQYWRERAQWCDAAGIEYWKVDWGVRSHSLPFRQMLTKITREEAPDIYVEHAYCMGPFNAPASPRGRFRNWDNLLEMNLQSLEQSDILRTYDVSFELGVASTMDRIAELIKVARMEETLLGLLNVEDEVYLGAALGFPVGVMRHPAWATTWPTTPQRNLYVDRISKGRRIDEVTRAIRWQRIAPPFGIARNYIVTDGHILCDSFTFGEELAWSGVSNREVVQGAPAMIARGIDLPEVSTDGESPFVVASTHPDTGAMAIATLPRTIKGKLPEIPLADVFLDVGECTAPVGVFGKYRSLTLRMSAALGNRRVWIQDLAGDQAMDITPRILMDKSDMTVAGDLLSEVGVSAGSPGDVSYPGLVIAVT